MVSGVDRTDLFRRVHRFYPFCTHELVHGRHVHVSTTTLNHRHRQCVPLIVRHGTGIVHTQFNGRYVAQPPAAVMQVSLSYSSVVMRK
jgi:hypothetical protein